MKIILYTVLSILILTSCNQTDELDGIWIVAYKDFEDHKAEPIRQKTLFEFDGNLVYTITIGDLDEGELNTVKIDTANYSFNNSILQIGNEKIPITYSQNSIIIDVNNNSKTVLKRINSYLNNVTINENTFKGSYFISSKNYNDSIDFINDSTLIFTGEYNSNYPTRKWNIIEYGGFKFFNIQNEYFPLLIFKSQTDKKTLLEHPFDEDIEFGFTKTTENSLSHKLIGNWKEIKINEPKPLPPFAGVKDGDQYYNLNFTKDSLLIDHFGRKENIKWSLSGDNQRIYFIDKIYTNQGSWKILESSEDVLSIRISASLGYFEEIIYLKKENNSR
jgi:hypothetical protein